MSTAQPKHSRTSATRDQAGRFVKGGTPPAGVGRPAGTLNVATKQIREICRELTFGNDKVYQRVKRECEDGTVQPGLFLGLVHLAYGKKKEADDEAPKRLPSIFLTHHPIGYDPLADAKPVSPRAQPTVLEPEGPPILEDL